MGRRPIPVEHRLPRHCREWSSPIPVWNVTGPGLDRPSQYLAGTPHSKEDCCAGGTRRLALKMSEFARGTRAGGEETRGCANFALAPQRKASTLGKGLKLHF
jgi:hypothetical protein